MTNTEFYTLITAVAIYFAGGMVSMRLTYNDDHSAWWNDITGRCAVMILWFPALIVAAPIVVATDWWSARK